ncbi:MAG: preprotein translocase subunit SecG [Gammaproteobacteria bacterium]|nr:preprotein translocase subunit SecG [Gammaproteobacteria bacterium]
MQVLNIFHVLIALALVGFVLIQKGQGATAGAAFGSGASGTVFGARGAGNFLTRSTWVLATLFCAISLTMAVMVSRMSAVPENDLGVVSSVQESPVVEDSQQPGEVSITSDEPLITDVPSFDSASDDLPSLETDAATDEVPAADSEEDSSGSGDGGS